MGTMEIILALILTISAEVGVDPHLAQAVALQENPALDPSLVSGPNRNGTNDLGIMGLNDGYVNHFVLTYWDKGWTFNWKTPYDNIYVGLRHLKWLLSIPELNTWFAVLAYNAGLQGMKDGPPESSIEYANRVFERYNALRKYKW
jgi:soluble lytic murein transglycosylase-like protein